MLSLPQLKPQPAPDRPGLSPSIGIGISTRDRWEDLAQTLERLEAAGLHHVAPTIVIDDGSRQPISSEMFRRFPWMRLLRSESSLGYIAQRNRLARELQTTLYLSLDDDSFVAGGDIVSAGRWLMDRPDVIALSFAIVPDPDPRPGPRCPPAEPAPVRFYIGCGHLVKRQLFLELGGYRHELEHLCEEMQFSLAAARRDYTIWYFPRVVIRHRRSPVGRDRARAHRLLTRNELHCAALYFPLPYFLMSVVNSLPRQFILADHRPYWRSFTGGFLEALRALPRLWRARAPLTLVQMRRWRRTSHPLNFIPRAAVSDGSAAQARRSRGTKLSPGVSQDGRLV
ncbi:MAG TPA: glycosyltransferase [Opitutaceae bacterium]|nr:glycosyltransferase [Opitutaceae bacterium]